MNYLEISGIIYIVSMGYAFCCDLYEFVLTEERKNEWRKIQKVK